MRFSFDGKSLAVGVFAGAAFVAGLGSTQSDGRSGIRAPAEPPAAGRYQIAAAGPPGGSAGYVVDTATGQVWSENDPRTREAFFGPKPASTARRGGGGGQTPAAVE